MRSPNMRYAWSCYAATLGMAAVWALLGYSFLPLNAPVGFVLAPAGAMYGQWQFIRWLYR